LVKALFKASRMDATMKKGKLTVATCQFPVTGDIDRNFGYIARQMRRAARQKADVAHFPEVALSGYAPVDIDDTTLLEYALLKRRTEDIMQVAGDLGLWVVLGSTHPLSGRKKPHNVLYVIDAAGTLVHRYDKMFCCGKGPPNPTEEHRFYSPGDRFVVFEINRVKCGLLICHDNRYPELSRQYKRMGVQLMFISYYNCTVAETADEPVRVDESLRACVLERAILNHFWISASNTSRPFSFLDSCFVGPDVQVIDKAPRHRAAILINEVDTSKKHRDPSMNWRDRAMRGIYHSGRLVSDPRSRRTDIL